MASTALFDTHLDLAWNAVAYGRDLLLPLNQIRQNEADMSDPDRGKSTVCLPALQQANVAVCLGTLLARAPRKQSQHMLRTNIDYANPTLACAGALGQLAYYELLEQQGHLKIICTQKDLDALWHQHLKPHHHSPAILAGSTDEEPEKSEVRAAGRPGVIPGSGPGVIPGPGPGVLPLGVILSMEGADPIICPAQLPFWWSKGLRTLSLAHYGQGVYAMGTGGDGPLTQAGKQLIKKCDALGIILDITHTADMAIDQALALYSRPMFASHANCRTLVDNDRQLNDHQIQHLAKRQGIVGVVLYNAMIRPGPNSNPNPNSHPHSQPRPPVTLQHLIDHIDHICQLTSSAKHVALGSDLDGGFGYDKTPVEINDVTDLQKLVPLLQRRGYDATAIEDICHRNALNFFKKTLPR